MKEWSDPYNPFNSLKVLMWREQLEGCASGRFLPPITVDLDITNECNMHCIWCNSYLYRMGAPGEMNENHLVKLVDFLKFWGVRSAHILGGGEPLMNKAFPKLLRRLRKAGIQAGVITNGLLLNEKLSDLITSTCRWVGVSVDAARVKTYSLIKRVGSEEFHMVKENLKVLSGKARDKGSKCSVCFKFLIHPLNMCEIEEAVVLAKSLGVHDFHARPVGWEGVYKAEGSVHETFKSSMHDFGSRLAEMERQFDNAMVHESDDFHVYGVRHKFTPDLCRKLNFSKCRATPIVLTFGPDGNCHLCGDRRGDKSLVLCSHFPDPFEVLKHWGGKRHKRLLERIKLKDCPRCILTVYNEIIEKVFIKDNMCRFFP